MENVIHVMKALADRSRLRILMMLRRHELCVCQIVEVLGLANSTVSKHLAVLNQARLVDQRKDSRWVYYRLPDPQKSDVHVAQAIGYVVARLKDNEQIAADGDHLARILTMSPEELCQTQNARG